MTGRRASTPRRRDASRWFGLLGTIGVLVGALALVFSWQATNGLPGTAKYRVHVDVPDANRVIVNNQVRIGGVRIGRVADVEAIPARSDAAGSTAVSRLTLELAADTPPISRTTTVRIRPASVLGATYVELRPGDGGDTVPDGGNLPSTAARSLVELTDLLDIFDRPTSRGIQRALSGVGGAVVGRGAALGSVVTDLQHTAPALTRLSSDLAAPATELRSFITALDQTITEVATANAGLDRLVSAGATTFDALATGRADLERTLRVFPGAAEDTTVALNRLSPVLDRLGRLSVQLRPAAAVLPAALDATARTFDAGVPAVVAVRRSAPVLTSALSSLRTFSERPTTDGVLRKVDELLGATGNLLEKLTPAQEYCNVVSLWGQNFAEAFGFSGSGPGPSTGTAHIKSLGTHVAETFQNREQIPNLHVNYLPNQNAQECESGNEPFRDDRRSLGNPAGLQPRTFVATTPPAGVRDRARRAGLLDDPPGAP